MRKLQVTITGPARRRKVLVIPDDMPAQEMVPELVERLNLPAHLHWRLLARSGKALKQQDTLASARVRAGQTLRLESLPGRLLKKFLDKLYDEAEGYVQEKLWDKALEKMEELHSYDPRYPDSKGLRKLAQMGITPSAIPSAGVSWGLVAAAIGAAVVGVTAVGAAVVVGGIIWVSSQSTGGGGGVTPAPGGGPVPHTGDVQITLEWDTSADLDLHVIDPFGAEIYHHQRQAASGGELDVDANYPCAVATANPIENVYWPWGGAPDGEYQVYVHYFGECNGEGTVEYQVIVRVDGEVIGAYPGALAPREQSPVVSFRR